VISVIRLLPGLEVVEKRKRADLHGSHQIERTKAKGKPGLVLHFRDRDRCHVNRGGQTVATSVPECEGGSWKVHWNQLVGLLDKILEPLLPEKLSRLRVSVS
jgi:hypothetical protein